MRLALLLLLVPLAAAAARLEGVPEVTLLRLEGRVGPPAPGHSAAAELVLDAAGRRYPFQVEEATVLSGTALASDVLAQLTPQRPSAYLRGPEPILAKLGQARPHDRVAITAYYRWGSRDLMVSGIVVTPAAPPAR